MGKSLLWSSSAGLNSHTLTDRVGREPQIREPVDTSALGVRGVSDEAEGPGGRRKRAHTDPSLRSQAKWPDSNASEPQAPGPRGLSPRKQDCRRASGTASQTIFPAGAGCP